MALLTPPPTAPQRGNRSTFANALDAFITWLINFVSELLALVGSLNSLAAGGSYSLMYSVDLTSTADGDPGTGNLRFDNATQISAATLRLDTLVGGSDVSALLDQFDASTSAVKGAIRLQKVGDPTKWLTFNVTARAAPSGYRNITVVNTGGSGANPFAQGDGVMLFFQRSGDKGDTGAVASWPTFYAREEQPSGTPASATGVTFNGWYARIVNTVKVNEITGASLSGNQITLPAGTYEFEGSMPGTGSPFRARLQNISDGVSIDLGTGEVAASGAYARSVLLGKFTIAATKVLGVQCYVNGSSFGSGQYTSSGSAEAYTEIRFRKVA